MYYSVTNTLFHFSNVCCLLFLLLTDLLCVCCRLKCLRYRLFLPKSIPNKADTDILSGLFVTKVTLTTMHDLSLESFNLTDDRPWCTNVSSRQLLPTGFCFSRERHFPKLVSVSSRKCPLGIFSLDVHVSTAPHHHYTSISLFIYCTFCTAVHTRWSLVFIGELLLNGRKRWYRYRAHVQL